MFNWFIKLFTRDVVQAIIDALYSPTSIQTFEKPETKPLHPDFDTMSKDELDVYARDTLDLNLDRRKTKKYMIEQIQNHLNKEN